MEGTYWFSIYMHVISFVRIDLNASFRNKYGYAKFANGLVDEHLLVLMGI